MNAVLHLNSWAGHTTHRVEIIRETKCFYIVRLLEDTIRNRAGDILERIPKYAISWERDDETATNFKQYGWSNSQR